MMENLVNIDFSKLQEKLKNSLGFFILINEGENAACVINDESMIRLLPDFLACHPDIFEYVVTEVEKMRAIMN